MAAGDILVAGGATNGLAASLASCELVTSGGATSVTGSMATARRFGALVTLDDGHAMMIGGYSTIYESSCEHYDADTGLWSATASMATARAFPSAVMLADGNVLVVAGQSPTTPYLDSVERYDHVGNAWSACLAIPGGGRNQHSSYLLTTGPNVGKVLVIGGEAAGPVSRATCYLYDPSNNTWAATGSMAARRSGHASTRLLDGRILVAGGIDAGIAFLSSCEIYDPATGLWTATGSLPLTRYFFAAATELDGQVLAIGSGPQFGDCYRWNPATGLWSNPGGALNIGRSTAYSTPHHQSIASFANGTIAAIAGGSSSSWLASTSVELRPSGGVFGAATPLTTARTIAHCALLAAGAAPPSSRPYYYRNFASGGI